MKSFIILLRGLTPTGKNKVLMAPLRAALTKAGLRDVQTYIQSGNGIVSTDLTQPALEQLVHEVISKEFGGDVAVLQEFRNSSPRSSSASVQKSRWQETLLHPVRL